MKFYFFAVLLVPALAAAQGVPVATDADRSKPSPLVASAASSIAPAAKALLANGLGLSLIESHRLPLVAVTLVIPRARSCASP